MLRDSSGGLTLFNALEEGMQDPSDPALVQTRKSAGFSPSAASAVVIDPVTKKEVVVNACNRKTWYSIMGYPKDDDTVREPRSCRITHAGDLISDHMVYESAKRMGVWAAEELAFFDPDNLLSGRLDLMAYIPGTKQKVIVEVKSMSPYMEVPWIKTGQKGFKLLEPRYKDLPQLMSYMQWWLQFGVRYGAIYYCSRDMNSNMFMFEWANVAPDALRPQDSAYLRCHSTERTWDLDFITWGHIRKRYSELRKHLKEGTEPPRDFSIEMTNRELFDASHAYGNATQFCEVNATEAKAIQAAFKKQAKSTGKNSPEDHPDPYMKKGMFSCTYCDYKTVCSTSLGSAARPKVSPENWESSKTPNAPSSDPVTLSRPRM